VNELAIEDISSQPDDILHFPDLKSLTTLVHGMLHAQGDSRANSMLKPFLIIAIVLGGYIHSQHSSTGGREGAGAKDAKPPAEFTPNGKPMLMYYFWAPSCGPCRSFEPTINAISTERKAVVVKLNMNENRETALKLNIQAIPCLILFKNGREVERIIGGVPKAEIEQMLAKHQ
jgi:thioredoxin 1